jgi:hypothetical protein
MNAWATEAGEFQILVGASSSDIRLSGNVTLEAEKRAARLHAGLTISTLLNDPNGRAILSKHIGGFLLMEDMKMAAELTLEQVAYNHPGFVPQEMVEKIEKELAQIK